MDTVKKTEPKTGPTKSDRKGPIPLSDRRRLTWSSKDPKAAVITYTDWASI